MDPVNINILNENCTGCKNQLKIFFCQSAIMQKCIIVDFVFLFNIMISPTSFVTKKNHVFYRKTRFWIILNTFIPIMHPIAIFCFIVMFVQLKESIILKLYLQTMLTKVQIYLFLVCGHRFSLHCCVIYLHSIG